MKTLGPMAPRWFWDASFPVDSEPQNERQSPGLEWGASLPAFYHKLCWLLRCLMIAAHLCLFLPASMAQGSQSHTIPQPNSCTTEQDGAVGHKKKAPQNASDEARNQAFACVELAFSPLDIQEYLQAIVRKQPWKIFDEHLTEDSWVFSRELNRDELLRATKRNSVADKVDWTKGVAFIHVNTNQLRDGIARTTIRAEFRGYGQSSDHFAVQREYWNLESNLALENLLVSALADHFAPPH
jgi:hypothetical protein